jgi:hypothetical protein
MLLETNCDRNLEAILLEVGRGQKGTITLGTSALEKQRASEQPGSRESPRMMVPLPRAQGHLLGKAPEPASYGRLGDQETPYTQWLCRVYFGQIGR